MIEFMEKINETPSAFTTLTLTYDQRQKSRLRVMLSNGWEAGIMLKRGSVIRHGDFLRSTDGLMVQIRAAEEEVAIASTADALLLAKACYHLGNRHVPLQIEYDCVSFQRDHVLEEMVQKLGLEVKQVTTAFEPESGAYSEGHSHDNHHHHD
jgi:urease accessory protein